MAMAVVNGVGVALISSVSWQADKNPKSVSSSNRKKGGDFLICIILNGQLHYNFHV